jgi:hypothetical protein
LLDQPYTFLMNRVLTVRELERVTRQRHVTIHPEVADILHAEGSLVPFLYVSGEVLRGPVRRDDLERAAAEGRLHDPATHKGLAREHGGSPLYSPYQLAVLGRVARLADARDEIRRQFVPELAHYRERAIAATVTEQVHLSRILGVLRLGNPVVYEAFARWRDGLGTTELAEWLGVDAAWFRTEGQALLSEADADNTLGGFAQLIGRAEPERWEELRGEPRRNLDLRLTAELLLREAERISEAPATSARSFSLRLRGNAPKDELLQRFGLSPHPRLVLIVEGRTELILLPRVYELLGGRLRDEHFRIVDAEGIDRDLGPLAAYLAPRIAEIRSHHSADFERPPIQALAVFDTEGPIQTPQDLEDARDAIVTRMMRTLPRDLDHPDVRAQLQLLVHVETWTDRGESFEFAHFSDAELATAIAGLDARRRAPDLATRTKSIASIRACGGNLTSALKGFASKGRLAEALWPVLERRIEDALADGTAYEIPAVRIIHLADDRAWDHARGTWVLALPDPDQR